MQPEQKNKKASEALARSRGGWSSKIHGALNGQGFPTDFYLSGREVHDSQYGPLLLHTQRAKYVLGDRAYAGQQLLDSIVAIGAEAVIPPHPRSTKVRSYHRVYIRSVTK